jgi:hypothetical protein
MTQSEMQFFVQKRREGWDNSQVRKELSKVSNLEDADVSFYVSQIDDLYVDTLEKPVANLVSKRIQVIIKMLAGILLISISLIAVIFSYENENVTMVKLVGAMILGGMALIINARRQKRKLENQNQSIKIKRNHKSKSFVDLFFGKW